MSRSLIGVSWGWSILGPLLLARAALYVFAIISTGAVADANSLLSITVGLLIYVGFIELYGLALLTVAPVAASIGSRLIVEAVLDARHRVWLVLGGAALLALSIVAFFVPQPEWGALFIRVGGLVAAPLTVLGWGIVLLRELRDPQRERRQFGRHAKVALAAAGSADRAP
ncbi:hypothetical protein [Schumannella luteola]